MRSLRLRFISLALALAACGGAPTVQAPAPRAATTADITPADLRTNLSGADELMAAAESEATRLNAIKGEASRLAVLAGAKTGRWTITSIDPDGIDLASASDLARLWFAERVTTLKQFEKALASPVR